MKKILIVEDEQDLRENITSLLEAKNYDVDSACDGLEALKKLRASVPDIIVSDIMMPHIDGYELYKRVRENEDTRFIPFLFLTAKSDLSSIRHGLSLGIDDYITKPFTSKDLIEAIRVRLEKSKYINDQIEEIKTSVSKYMPHELRTPLVAILGYSQLILSEVEGMGKEEIKDMAERINFGAKRLHNRIEKFIQLVEIDQTPDLNESSAPAADFNKDIIDEIISENFLIKDRAGDIKTDIQNCALLITKQTLKKILFELIENALKFSPSGSDIEIRGRRNDSSYTIQIKDYGIGMNENQIQKIGVFKQFDREVMQQEGNGLGLIYTIKALRKAGGSVFIQSEKNSFTSLIISIPVSNQ